MKRIIYIAVSVTCGAMIVVFVPALLRTDEENTARRIAKDEGYKRGWGFVHVKTVASQSNQWIVTIERFPSDLGGHATVEIVDGKVTKYRLGK